ncbi:hypothetical protein C5Y93_26705 [Blastopirellula marina]|uniref:PEGA domain-containing protein n=2 Tax=Blastopirellula marina TaxID=124 RepID=A0A2S8GFP8_9BACT|nr:hypothetical protein C5Y93_26705 [Blastopirellula marina]
MNRRTLQFRNFLLVTVLLACASTGCVRRRMNIRTNPPGAVVYVDDQEIGVTPVSANYVHYGTREIRLEKDGYESVSQMHTFRAPWYEYPVLEFFSENLWPWEIRDTRDLDFTMTPRRIVPPEELRSRAEQLRANAQAGYVTPMNTPPNPAVNVTPQNQPQLLPPVMRPETLPEGGFVLPPPVMGQ